MPHPRATLRALLRPARPFAIGIRRPLLLSAALWLLAACSEQPANQAAPKRPNASAHLVTAVTLAPTALTLNHERPGSLRYRRLARLHNQEEGRITALPVFEGDRVAKGRLLVQLEDDLLRAELDKVRATLQQERLDLERLQGLKRKRAVSEDELAQAATALVVAQAEERLLQTRLAYTRIQAPFDGVVTERRAEPGDAVSRNTHLLTLADPASLIAEVYASELVLPQLGVDDPVSVRIDALGRQAHAGRILRIHPALDPVTRQGVVEVVLDPSPPGARSGQFVRAQLRSAASERLLVPFSALRRDRDGEFVYLVGRDGKTERVGVRSGLRIAQQVEIRDGLEPGQRVITRGFLGLSAGQPVEVVPDTGG